MYAQCLSSNGYHNYLFFIRELFYLYFFVKYLKLKYFFILLYAQCLSSIGYHFMCHLNWIKICHLIFWSFFILLFVQFNFILFWICFHVSINCVSYANRSFDFFHTFVWSIFILSTYLIAPSYSDKMDVSWRIHQTPTPLHPGSTFINGFFNVITYKIADFNSYHLRFYFWRSIIKCGNGTQGVAFGAFVKACPSRRFCSLRSYIMMIRFLSSIGYDFMCRW